MRPSGKVYLVGAGPGDPLLLTLKGLACLGEADLVLYDGLVNPLLLYHSQAHAERTCRVGSGTERHLDQAEINARLIAAARAGKTVVRLKGGDPFIFGRGSEEAAALADAGIPFEVIPGITAGIAAPEYAGISLTHRELASAVAFVTGHEDPSKPESALDYRALVAFPGTLVFYMGLHRLPDIARTLIEKGKSAATPVAVISRGCTPRQRVVTGRLDEIAGAVADAGLRPPSLIIVGDCVSQRERINWFDRLPLSGVSIGITRPEGQANEEISLALRMGADPVPMSTMNIAELDDWSVVDAVLERLPTFQWIVFTSVNGVEAFLERLWETGADVRALSHVKIAAIGPATADRLAQSLLRADIVPPSYRAESLAESLAPHVAGQRVLWVRANRGRDVLPERLQAAGAILEEVVVYRHEDTDSLPSAALERLRAGELHWIALSSPAIARQIALLLGDLAHSSGVRFAAISPVTADAAKEAGLTVSAVADDHTWPGLFEVIRAACCG